MAGVMPPWVYLKAPQANPRLQVSPHELSFEIRRAERPLPIITTAAFAGCINLFSSLWRQNRQRN